MNKTIIEEAKASLDTNIYHHLDAKYRNLIFKKLLNKQSINLILNTLNINQDVFTKKSERIDFDKTLKNLVDFTGGNINKDDFKENNDFWFTYYENQISDGNLCIGYAGLSIVYAGYEFGRELYENEIDEVTVNSDPYNWSSLFYGSLVYSGGTEDIAKIDSSKNYIYWIFFLNNYENSNFLFKPKYFSIQHEDIAFQRVQKFEKGINPAIDRLYLSMYDKLTRAKFKLECKTIEVFIISINNSFSIQIKADGQSLDNTKAYFLNVELDLKPLVQEIKENMYSIAKNEGAWFDSKYILDKQDNLVSNFNFDNKSDCHVKFVSISDFREEIEKFPRNKEFTKEWLMDIIR